jgi:hypothetical protein
MTSRIKIKFGDIEVEYEGEEKFLTAELPKLISDIAALHRTAPATPTKGHGHVKEEHKEGVQSATTLAQRLDAKKLPDLILAGALAIALRGQPSFERKELRKEIQGAIGFYKNAMGTNLEKTLTRLAKSGKITHSGGENYALSPDQKSALQGRLK